MASRRRSFEALVGRVARRATGRTRAARMSRAMPVPAARCRLTRNVPADETGCAENETGLHASNCSMVVSIKSTAAFSVGTSNANLAPAA